MILQEQCVLTAKTNYQRPATEPLLIGCPVCGRPARIRQHLVGEELACSSLQRYICRDRTDGWQQDGTIDNGRPAAKRADSVCSFHADGSLPRAERTTSAETTWSIEVAASRIRRRITRRSLRSVSGWRGLGDRRTAGCRHAVRGEQTSTERWLPTLLKQLTWLRFQGSSWLLGTIQPCIKYVLTAHTGRSVNLMAAYSSIIAAELPAMPTSVSR